MGFQLREALRRLCVEIGWSYAVFWRSIRCRDQMHLVWGDGHRERAGISGFEAMDLLLKERVALRSSHGDPFAEIEGETEDRVSSLVYKMMANQVHVVGDGIVGQVALTGKHQWILRDSLIDYGSVPKGLVEMNHQFLAGIKTIAVVPVLPHGVVQLGSTQMVMENTGLINHIRNIFTQLECIPGALASDIFTQNIHGLPIFLDQAGDSGTSVRRVSNLDGDGYNHHPLDDVLDRRRSIVQPSSSFTQVSGKPPANASEVPHDISFEGQQAQHHQTQILTSSSSLSSNVLFSKELLSISEQSNTIQMISKSFQPRRLTSIQNPGTSPTEGHQSIDTQSVEFNKQHSSIGSQLVTQDIWLSNWSPIHGKDKTESAVFVRDDNTMKNDKSLQDPNKRTALGHVCPNSGNDLFDLLGLNNKSAAFYETMDDVVLHSNDSNALNDEFYCSGLFSQASPDQLLDAVVSHISSDPKQTLDVSASIKTSETDISSSSGLPKQEVVGPASLMCSMDKTGGSLHNDGSYKSQIDLWVNKGKDVITDNNSAAHCKWIDEVGKMNKKRPRPGENPRPRPKDRQMIQDRVKELREIVPNGAKCSIDALLEKTIKHMLFLQGVTKHADKLKEIGEPKIMSKEGGLLMKDDTGEGSSTWAFEVGSRSMICPIIVEDLNSPRQMLVEMLCEQRGLFLEIADLIRGMGLTILKGVIEARDGKVWARFAVEANRDITRMEIFLSLVQLLEPNAGSNSMALHCAESSRACTIV